MSFVNAVRQILRDAGEPLTSAEIRDRLEEGYPEFWPQDSGPYATVPIRVIARVGSAATQANDIETDKTVHPMLIGLIGVGDIFNSTVGTSTDEDNLDCDSALPIEHDSPRPAGSSDHFVLEWTRCSTYEEAQNHSGIIYLHEWDGKPYYWGIARTYFGGSTRPLGDRRVSGRYNSGYRHWIEGCLQHGARLYVAKIISGDESRIQELENFLICTYGHVANRRETALLVELALSHNGDIPTSVTIHVADIKVPKATMPVASM